MKINKTKTNKTKTVVFSLALIIFSCITVFAQSKSVPDELVLQLNAAKNNGDTELAKKLNKEVEKYLEVSKPESFSPEYVQGSQKNNIQHSSSWYSSEIHVSGLQIGDKEQNQIQIKQGFDGNLYAVIISKNNSGANYGLEMFKSVNGGVNWTSMGGLGFTDIIISVSFLIESRNKSIPDSTRLWVFYTISTLPNGDNAKLNVHSRRVNGSSHLNITISTPQAGNKYEQVTACSDGAYFSEMTFLHVIVREAANNNTYAGLRHFRTTSWAETFSNSLLSTGGDLYYPSASLLHYGNVDSIYIAAENRVSGTESAIRVVSTPDIPANSYILRYLGTINSNIKYEKPVLTIAQRSGSLIKSFMMSCTKNNVPFYFHSTNNGLNWSSEQQVMNSSNIKSTWCSSDSLDAGGSNFAIACITTDGDSVSVFQGTPGAMNLSSAKINSQLSSGLVSPVCAIYRQGPTKNAVALYSGLSRTNLFFNGSHLITGIQNINSNIPDGFNLSQNYPNPFNPVTNIEFSVPKSGNVKLTVFDITGKQIDELVNSQMNAGTYKADFNAGSLSSGIYFYALEADGFKQTKKMILVK